MSPRGIEEILTEALGPPVGKQRDRELIFYLVASKSGSAKRTRDLLKKKKTAKAKKLRQDVTFETLELAIEELRWQLTNFDEKTMNTVAGVPKTRSVFDGIRRRLGESEPCMEPRNPTAKIETAQERLLRDLKSFSDDFGVVKGWAAESVKWRGYKGGADPNYEARDIALLAAEAYLEWTGNMPSLPNYQAGPEGSPYSRLLVKLFKRFGFDEGSIWNAGKWAVDEMAKKD